MLKVNDKERISKAAREKQLVTYRGIPIRLSADFSKETHKLEDIGKKYSKQWKTKDLQAIILYPAKLSFRMKGQIKSFSNKKKQMDYVTTKPELYEMLKDLL